MKKHVNTEACLKKEKRHKDMTTVFKTNNPLAATFGTNILKCFSRNIQ